MKVKYIASKGNRIKKMVFGLEAITEDGYPCLYNKKDKKWYTWHDKPKDCTSFTYTNTSINSVKSAIRHIKNSNLPKGTKFIVNSHFVGHDVIIIK